MSAIKTLLLLLCVFYPSSLCEAAVCYVKPTEPPSATCPSEPCHTLDEYVSNSTRYFVSNTVFMFLTGYHHLSHNLTVSDVHNITLRPYIEKSDVVIDSKPSISLVFELSSDTVIRDMTFKTLSIRFENNVLDTNVTLSNSYFERAYDGAVTVINSVLHIMGDVVFRNNSNSYAGGAILSINSVLLFTGNITFIDNHSDSVGGAVSLLKDGRILIPEPQKTHILFENNTANDVGGAIYFSSLSTDFFVLGYCKLYIEQISNKTVLNFTMNSASNGGYAIYGAYLDDICYAPNGNVVQNLSHLILSASSFSPSLTEKPSIISSDAQNLCFCDSDDELGNCCGTDISVYPGQVFGLPVAVHGDLNSLVKWPVYAVVQQGVFGSDVQQSQITSAKKCTNFYYSVLSNKSSATLRLSLRGSKLIKKYTYDYKINFLECPLGFATSSNNKCKCDESLQNIETVNCDITDQSIQRQGTIWIGVLENNIKNSILAYSKVCPFNYCKKLLTNIYVNQSSLFNEDIQCTDNRSGVLCGRCRDNFSLALGSNRCLHDCSNNRLSLIIAFATAGIALVFFIKILNLTVSQGTINGLIFYTNIIGAKQEVLLSSNAYERFLSVFISWMNLDLGIETCFLDGMDTYIKAWLQFVFPMYVWAIALFIIILSHYSIHASRLFGNNSVPVLATLILLSYSKLLRAIISALSITDIQFLNGSTMSVWEKDGNIQYLTGKHIPLFVFAIVVLILLWFPFTLVLVTIQWLQRATHYRVLSWITKLMPFFDAFTGPFKDKHRYWVGFLLLARCSLLLIFYIYTANGNGVAFVSTNFAALIILVFLAATGLVYRNYYLALLELSYILNIGILAAGILYMLYINHSGNQEALVITSVSIVFLQFLATVIYHACVQLKILMEKFKLKTRIEQVISQGDTSNNNEPGAYEALDESSFAVIPLQRPSTEGFREPLLEYLSD